jgi:hypothetical protein
VETFIQQFPGVILVIMYGGGMALVSMAVWGIKKALGMLNENMATLKAQDQTLIRIERKTDNHDTRIRSLEFHAWGREPPRMPPDEVKS